MSRNPVRRDTRKHGRATLELAVLVRDSESRARGTIRFDAADVSGGGAFLRSDLLFEIGELLTIEFDLPGGPRVSARGRVVRVSRGSGGGAGHGNGHRDEPAGMGVEFIDLAPEHRAAIEERL